MGNRFFAALTLITAGLGNIARAEPVSDIIVAATPQTGSTDVPTNAAAIWRLSLSTTAPPEVTAAVDGNVVDLVVTLLEASTPGEALLIVRHVDGVWPATASVAISLAFAQDLDFLTGDGPINVDDGAPDVIQIGGGGYVSSRATYGYEENFFALVDGGVPGDLLVHDFAVVDGDDDVVDTFTGAGAIVWSFTGEWTDPHFGARVPTRFATLRIDGTFSPWSAPVTLTLPGNRDCDGVDDDNDDCPDQPGGGLLETGCPDQGASMFRCEPDGSLCLLTDAFGFASREPPVCSELAESEGEGEGETEGDGCGAGAVAAPLVLLGLLRRRRTR